MEVTDINSNTHNKTAKEVYKSLWFKRKATPVVYGKTKQASGKQWAYV